MNLNPIYLLPSFFTLGNIFCGFYSIITSIHGSYGKAAYIIIAAGLFDVFDGKIARATNSTSKFGVEFDSLADLVSFGVAPSLLVYLWTLRTINHQIGWLVAFLFVACGALRLARFNTLVGVVSSDRFIGLPIPFGAAMLVSTMLFHDYWFGRIRQHPALIAILVGVVAVLMVSNIRYRSFKGISLPKRNPFAVMVGATLILIVIASKPQVTLFLISSAYLLMGLVEWGVSFRKVPGFFPFHKPRNQQTSPEDGQEKHP